MIWSLGLWWIWKVVNEHKEEHGTRFPPCNTTARKCPFFFSLRFRTIKERERVKKIRSRVWGEAVSIVKDFFLASHLSLMAIFLRFAFLPWVVTRWCTFMLFECREEEKRNSCVKGNSRLLFHWPDDDVQSFKMALNKLMSSRQEGDTHKTAIHPLTMPRMITEC